MTLFCFQIDYRQGIPSLSLLRPLTISDNVILKILFKYAFFSDDIYPFLFV